MGSIMLIEITLVLMLTDLSESEYIGSSYCQDLQNCSSSIERRSNQQVCHCDELCGIFNDCCPDFVSKQQPQVLNDQISCEYVKGMGTISLVTKCPTNWPNDHTRTLCENSTQSEDIMSKVIVSDKAIEGLVFRNMHCAMCNDVYDYTFWKVAINCPSYIMNTTSITQVDLSQCAISFDEPNVHYRECSVYTDTIEHCSLRNDSIVVEKCERGTTLLVSFINFLQFKNKYCAICNGYDEFQLECMKLILDGFENPNQEDFFSFRVLVDFNQNKAETQDYMGNKNDFQMISFECDEDQIYDPIIKQCRLVMCPNNTRPFKGKCYAKSQDQIMPFSSPTEQCAYSKIQSHEFQYKNETNQILFRQNLFNESEYIRNGSDIFLCINTSAPSHNRHFLQASDELEGYLSFAGLIISIVSLLITVIIYIIFSELLNLPGKNLVSLCSSLFIAQLLFLLSPKVSSKVIVCQVFAISMHYLFLAAFSWMNVIAFDLLMTFSNTIGIDHRARSPKKKFIMYSIYSWIVPLIVVFPAIIFDYVIDSDSIQEFKPLYGKVGCWISSNYALLLFFVGPLALLKLFDFIAFGFIVFYIMKAKRQGAMARNENNSCTFFIHLKLSLVMGLTWVFAFVANFGGSSVLWYLYIIFNTLQGLFIAISFVCTRRVLRLIKSRYCLITSMTSRTTQYTENTVL